MSLVDYSVLEGIAVSRLTNAPANTYSCDTMREIDDLPDEGWWDAVLQYARQFLPPGRAAMAVGRIKRSVQTGAEIPLEAGLAIERELQQQLFLSEDAGEGIAAYNEKRKLRFKGC